MATATKRNGKSNLQVFVKEQLEDAQKRFAHLEGEAQKVFDNLAGRARESRKELEVFVQRFNGFDQLKDRLDQLKGVSGDVQKRLTTVQSKVIESVGVASQAQVSQISRELTRVSKKLDTLMGKKG
jgi:uncharacterized protein YukE